MRTLTAFILVFFNLPLAEAQINLVPNPSFEDTLNCDSFGYPVNAGYPWFTPTNSTPDYFYGLNPSCGNSALQNPSGFQLPYDGDAYVGLFLAMPISSPVATRDYISVKLLDTLLVGKNYKIEFYVSRANLFYLATDDIGAYVSFQFPLNSGYSYLPYQPQVENTQGNIITDSLNWTLISGVFTAFGGENYLTIGNFKDSINTTIIDADSGNGDNNSSYYYIDKVSLICLDSLQIIDYILNENNFIELFPTLLHSGTVIQINSKFQSNIEFDIISIDGKFIRTGKLLHGSNQFSTERLNPGVFVIKFRTPKSIISKKIIIY